MTRARETTPPRTCIAVVGLLVMCRLSTIKKGPVAATFWICLLIIVHSDFILSRTSRAFSSRCAVPPVFLSFSLLTGSLIRNFDLVSFLYLSFFSFLDLELGPSVPSLPPRCISQPEAFTPLFSFCPTTEPRL